MLTLFFISFGAAIVNGVLGYGFSSVAVPLALLFLTNRALNPAVVLIEVPLNAYVVWINRHAIRDIIGRVGAISVGIAPGVVAGTLILSSVDANRLKLMTYVILLPLVVLQAAGFRRAIRAEGATGVAFGSFIGVLYAMTTISGPPLAMFLNNQGFANARFRAALGVVRLIESTLALALYTGANLLTTETSRLVCWMAPALLIGIPLGASVSRRIPDEAFRRVCMTFDAIVIALGASTLLHSLRILDGASAYVPFGVAFVVGAILVLRFFRATDPDASSPTTLSPAQRP